MRNKTRVTPHATIAYADESANQVLDLYIPVIGAEAPRPVVVAIHGGAFAFGNRMSELNALTELLDRGWAVASVEYRLSGEAQFPAAVRDVKQAVGYLRSHSAEWNLDPAFFAAWGRSAGGYLSAMLGVTTGQVTVFDEPSDDSGVQAVIDWYGPSDFLLMDTQFIEGPPDGQGPDVQVHDEPQSPESLFLGGPIQQMRELAQQANPITYIRSAPQLPPFFLAAGTNDRLIPYQQTLILGAALREHGADVDLRLLTGAGHGDRRFEKELTSDVLNWLLTLHAGRTDPGRSHLVI
ncbi:alpha/beta hydrolase fold domain-containing protein [Nakamurella sp. GG22]